MITVRGTLSRRKVTDVSNTKKIGAALIAGLCASMALTGCAGGSGDGDSGPKAGKAEKDVTKLVSINPQDAANLEQGGTFRTFVGSFGPNFNTWANAGNSSDTVVVLRAINQAGCFTTTADGKYVLDKDFCTEAETTTENGKQVIKFTFNPKANFNDGTPLDVNTVKNMFNVLSGKNKAYDLIQTKPWDTVEKVEAGSDSRHVIITMKQNYAAWQDVIGSFFHPKINTPEIFNKGFVNKIHPEWYAGPFTVSKFDPANKTIVEVPNSKWWGKKPHLDQIVIRQIDDQASLSAYKNGEINVVGAGTPSRYRQAASTPNNEFRRGQQTGVFGYLINTKADGLTDVNVRKAIYEATDRAKLAATRFQGLNWTEPVPGSWMSLPIQSQYKDNVPVKYDVKAAEKTMTDAGYKKGSDGKWAKNGKKVSFSLTNFGDDPQINAIVQRYQKQLTDAGFDAKIDQRGEQDFNATMEKKDFGIVAMGYSIGNLLSDQPTQYFGSGGGNTTGCSPKGFDKKADAVTHIIDDKKRNDAVNALEAEWQKACYAMIPAWNGPSISAVNKYLANYGPSMFKSTDWTMVGWMKGHKDGK